MSVLTSVDPTSIIIIRGIGNRLGVALSTNNTALVIFSLVKEVILVGGEKAIQQKDLLKGIALKVCPPKEALIIFVFAAVVSEKPTTKKPLQTVIEPLAIKTFAT